MTERDFSDARPAEGLASVEGPSFSPTMKVLSSVLVLGLLAGGGQVLQQGAWAQWNSGTRWLMGGVGAVILMGYWGILRSRTSMDGHCIRQSWLWHKEVRLADITRLKLIHVPGWTWLVSPRLVVQAGAIGVTTFHVADPKLIEAMKKLAYG
jgi:hypothetical protein